MSVSSQSHTETQPLYWEIMNGGKEVNLSNRRGIDMEQVSKALFHPDSAVVTLRLFRCRIDDDTLGSIRLAEVLKINSTLTTLDLTWSEIIGDDGAFALAEALETNATLTTLDLCRNALGDDGSIALAEALKTNATLTALYLQENAIGTRGALALAEALKTNTTLTTLMIGFNEIGTLGGLALADALKTNATLTMLDLQATGIGTDGALALAEALKANATLTALDLDNNALGDDGFIALAEVFKTNTTLTELELCSDEVFDCLEEDGRRLLNTVEKMTYRNSYKARLESIKPAFVLGSISEMVDVLAENTGSLSYTFDLLRVRMSWVRCDGSSVGNHPSPVLIGPGHNDDGWIVVARKRRTSKGRTR